MNIRVVREPSLNATTLGVVFLDGRFFSFSLEDQIREVPGQSVSAWKIPGETAIPAGRYRVGITFSPKFNKLLPEVFAVPGFSGIRIHPGNVRADTEGCLLLGVQRADARVIDSTTACTRLHALIAAAAEKGEQTWLLIENPLEHG